MPDGSERVARNQAMFREVNERIETLLDDVTTRLGRLDSARTEKQQWVCECCDEACVETVGLSVAEYEEVRAYGDRFAVAPEHIAPLYERVLSHEDGYWLIQKVGTAGEYVRDEDPRRTSLEA